MQIQEIDYFDKDVKLCAYVAYQEPVTNKKPAILIAHDWSGRNEFACEKARKLAELGYVGVAIDMFGKGVLGKNNDEKSQLIQPLVENRAHLRDRMLLGLTVVQQLEVVDTNRIGAIGFCFGGLCALDLARAGANLRGVVSFHGLLNAPNPPLPQEKVKAKILALHGYNDPMVTPEQVAGFEKEMTAAQVDWQIHIYGNTMHAFTNPIANDKDFGTVYNEVAAKRSWIAMQNFFAEVFG